MLLNHNILEQTRARASGVRYKRFDRCLAITIAALTFLLRQVVWAVGFMTIVHRFLFGHQSRLYVILGALFLVGIGMAYANKKVRK